MKEMINYISGVPIISSFRKMCAIIKLTALRAKIKIYCRSLLQGTPPFRHKIITSSCSVILMAHSLSIELFNRDIPMLPEISKSIIG